MPRIRVSGVSMHTLSALRPGLFDDLERLMEVSREHLVLLASGDTLLPEPGQTVTPFVEVAGFEREPGVQDKVARVLTRHLKAAGCSAPDVVFLPFRREAYYEDGTHF